MIQRFLLVIIVFSLNTVNLSCNSKSGKRKTDVTSSTTANLKVFLSVTKVVDGDTFWAEDESRKSIKIRLIGVDAPESRNSFKKKVGYYGKEAKAYLTNLLTGKKVRLEYDVNRADQYGRTLAYVYLQDDTFVNAELIKNGYALIMTVPPNVKYANEFAELQQEARKNNRGLWGISNQY